MADGERLMVDVERALSVEDSHLHQPFAIDHQP